MRIVFDVDLYTRPADRFECTKRRVALTWHGSRAEAADRFWTVLEKAGFKVHFQPAAPEKPGEEKP